MASENPGALLDHAPELRVVRDGPRRYRLIGELDLGTAPHLRAAVAQDLTLPPGHLALDMRELAFVDGAGVRSLTLIDQALDGGLRLLSPTPQARRVMDLSAPPRLHVLG